MAVGRNIDKLVVGFFTAIMLVPAAAVAVGLVLFVTLLRDEAAVISVDELPRLRSFMAGKVSPVFALPEQAEVTLAESFSNGGFHLQLRLPSDRPPEQRLDEIAASSKVGKWDAASKTYSRKTNSDGSPIRLSYEADTRLYLAGLYPDD